MKLFLTQVSSSVQPKSQLYHWTGSHYSLPECHCICHSNHQHRLCSCTLQCKTCTLNDYTLCCHGDILAGQPLADISWLLSLLWHYSYQNDPSLEYFQQASWAEDCEYLLITLCGLLFILTPAFYYKIIIIFQSPCYKHLLHICSYMHSVTCSIYTKDS